MDRYRHRANAELVSVFGWTAAAPRNQPMVEVMVAHIVFILGTILVPQPQAPRDAAPPQEEEESIIGFPEGEPAPLPDQVSWDFAKVDKARTKTRERITLHGLWRFTPVPERDTPVIRREMGWIDMPGSWLDPGSRVFDTRLRVADGLWRGKPLDGLPWAWVERDLIVTDTAKWISRRIFLIVRGPWARAEVFVNAEPIQPTDRDGEGWYEITESLIYPGTSQLSMRLQDTFPEAGNRSDPKTSHSLLALELVPTGPRVDKIELRPVPQRDAIDAVVRVVHPKGIRPVTGGPKRTAVLALRLDSTETGATVYQASEEVGPLREGTGAVTIRIPLAERADDPLSPALRLHLQLLGHSAILDEPFPVEFHPAGLKTLK